MRAGGAVEWSRGPSRTAEFGDTGRDTARDMASWASVIWRPSAVAPLRVHDVATDGTTWHPRDLRDERLAAALAAGATYHDAAASSGHSLRTAKRRGADPDFAAYVDGLRRDVAKRVARRLGELADRACDTLGDLLSSAEPAPTRHAAARTILDAGAKLREQAELVERIEALEARRPDPRLRSVS